jgi:predicted metal-binding protein
MGMCPGIIQISPNIVRSAVMDKYNKYLELAKKKGMIDAVILSPADICFDIRTQLKCAWGCDRQFTPNAKCDNRGLTFDERIKIVKQYKTILLLHSHDVRQLGKVLLEMEKTAFLDGYYLAFAVNACHICKECRAMEGKDCLHPEKVRPCACLFGLDIYRTVRKLGLPCEVLQNKESMENRYGLLLIN